MPHGDPSLALRQATPDDAPRMAQLSIQAYPRAEDGAAARAERYLSSNWFALSDCTLAEREGRLVGQCVSIPFTGWFGGVETKVGGLAGVAVAPEARRSGVAARLIARHLQLLEERRDAWAMLYPFSPRFYAAYGWAPAARKLRWDLAPAELPSFPERTRVRTLQLGDAGDLARVQRCYERHCVRTNGSLLRTTRQLAAVCKPDQIFVVGVPAAEGALDGYLTYFVRATTNRPQTMVVTELVALDDAATRAMYGFLAAQADQFERVELDTPPADPLPLLANRGLPLYEDSWNMPHEHHALGRFYSGAMLRVVSLARALEGRGYPGGSGRLAFQAEDALVPANEAPVTLTVEDGRGWAVPGAAAGVPLVEARSASSRGCSRERWPSARRCVSGASRWQAAVAARARRPRSKPCLPCPSPTPWSRSSPRRRPLPRRVLQSAACRALRKPCRR